MPPEVVDKRELGTLVVVVLKARNLKDNHSFYKQDPYAVLRFGGIGKSTKVDPKGGQHPVWDEELHFPVYKNETDRTLKITCFSKETKIDEMLGEGSVDMSDTLRRGEFDDWVPLKQDDQNRGDVYLECTFYSAVPPPQRRPSKLKPIDRLWRPPATPPKDSKSLPSPQSSPRRYSPSRKAGPELRDGSPSFLNVPEAGAAQTHTYVPAADTIPQSQSQSQGALPLRVPSILRPTHPKSNPLVRSSSPGVTDLLQPRLNNRELEFPLDLYPNEPPLPNPFDTASLPARPNRSQSPRERLQQDRRQSRSPPRRRPQPQHILDQRSGQPPDLPPKLPLPSERQPTPDLPEKRHQSPQSQHRSGALPKQSHQPKRRSESPFRRPLSPRSQAKADEEYAYAIAQSEGIDIAKLKQEERDEELARKVWEEQIDSERNPEL